MNEKHYKRTWEKFDPVDFKKTFVLFPSTEVFINSTMNNILIIMNNILQRTVTNDPI
jgi:hypothetical protein